MVSSARVSDPFSAFLSNSSDDPVHRSRYFRQVERDRINAEAMAKLLHVVEREMLATDVVKRENKELWQRLGCAFALRESPVHITKQVEITYTVVREWMLYQVITAETTRPWGLPSDLQELAISIGCFFPLGIIVLHHEMEAAFRFSLIDAPTIIPVLQAVSYAAKFPKCLLLARITMHDGGHVFARLTADYIQKKRSSAVANADMRGFLLARSLEAPTLPWKRGQPRSTTSLSELSGNDEEVSTYT